MAGIGGSQSEAFGLGINHLTNASKSNENSLTLADASNGADQGLDATSARWSSMSPHGVLQTALGGSDDGSFERYQRSSGGYAPGSMRQLQDQLDQGSNDNTP